MKKFQILFAAAVFGVVLGVTANASAESSQIGSATVVRCEGLVSYSLGNNQWAPLVSGKVLPVGAMIRTDYNGSADVVLGKDINLPQNGWQSHYQPQHIAPTIDASVRGNRSWSPSAEQNVIRIMPGTLIGISKLTITDTGADTVSDTELDLKQGKIFASVKKITGASQYLIKLPNGIAGVRGTKFSIDFSGNVVDYESTGGGVIVSLLLPGSTTPFTITVPPGFNFDPATGKLTGNADSAQQFLDQLFTALQTIYSPLHWETREHEDATEIYISPTHGAGGTPPPPPEDQLPR